MLTAVVPLYNEEATLIGFHQSLASQSVVNAIIYVDDGSSDNTLRLLRGIASTTSTCKINYVSLGRNYGKDIALLCGLDHCEKESTVVVLDGDGQHPVTAIKELYNCLGPDVDVAFAARATRAYQDLCSKTLSKGYYWLLKALIGIEIDDELGDFFCAKAHYAKALRLYRSPSLFFKCIYPDIGFRVSKVPVVIASEVRPSRFGSRKKLSIASSSIFYTSSLPLRIIAPLGAMVSFFSLVAIFAVLVQYAFAMTAPPGYLTIVFLINFYSGIIVFVLGILARYLELIMRDALQKPVYTVKESSTSC